MLWNISRYVILLSVIGLGFVIIILAIKKKKSVRYFFLYLVGGFIILSSIVFLGKVLDDSIVFNHYNNQSIETSVGDEISIKEVNGKKILWDNTSDSKLQCGYEDKQPVYIKKLDRYDVIVFSIDPNKNYDDGRFLVGDYELNNKVDTLAVLDLEAGRLTTIVRASLIGSTIDLTSIDDHDTSITFSTFTPLTDNKYTYYIKIMGPADKPDPYSYPLNVLMNAQQIFYPYFGVEEEEYYNGNIVSDMVGSKDYCYLYKEHTNDGDKVTGARINVDIVYYDDRVSSMSFNLQAMNQFDNQVFVQQGYYTEKNDEIYYIDNDMNLMKMSSEGLGIKVKELHSLDGWMNEIPNE